MERLHHNRIYPIVLLIKFKSVKQIKEVKDPRYHAEKINQKDAKNIYEHTLKLEAEYKHLISGKDAFDIRRVTIKFWNSFCFISMRFFIHKLEQIWCKYLSFLKMIILKNYFYH